MSWYRDRLGMFLCFFVVDSFQEIVRLFFLLQVVSVEDPSTGEMFVIKSIADTDSNCPVKEMGVMFNENLNSPFILKYHSSFRESGYTHILMEYCEKGDLDHFVRSQKVNVNETVFILFLFLSICAGNSKYIWTNCDGDMGSTQTQDP
jgi:serine/threonine protein kinase